MDIQELVDDRQVGQGKPFPCRWPECGKAFNRRSDLQRHSRIHTNDRPYACQTCGKAFIQRSALTVHTRVHTGERPHQCEWLGCGKAFSDSSSLARHRRIHTGNRPYKCDYSGCTKSFCRKTTMTKHYRRMHIENKVDEDSNSESSSKAPTPASFHTTPDEDFSLSSIPHSKVHIKEEQYHGTQSLQSSRQYEFSPALSHQDRPHQRSDRPRNLPGFELARHSPTSLQFEPHCEGEDEYDRHEMTFQHYMPHSVASNAYSQFPHHRHISTPQHTPVGFHHQAPPVSLNQYHQSTSAHLLPAPDYFYPHTAPFPTPAVSPAASQSSQYSPIPHSNGYPNGISYYPSSQPHTIQSHIPSGHNLHDRGLYSLAHSGAGTSECVRVFVQKETGW